MKSEEVIDKIEIMKSYLEEFYQAGIIKPNEYNDMWARINDLKTHVKYEE